MIIVVASPLQCSSSHVSMKMENLKAFHLKASYSYIEIRLSIFSMSKDGRDSATLILMKMSHFEGTVI